MASGPITSWQIDGETMETVTDFLFLGSKITADGDCCHEIKRHLLLGRNVMTNLGSILKSRDITLPTKVHLVKAMFFSSSHVWMRKLNHKESRARKNWCFWTVVLQKTRESHLDSKEIKTVNPKGNQSWIFIGRAEAEAPILWPPDAKNWLIRKDPDAGKDWRQEMVGWHHWLNGHEFEQAPGVGDGQGSLGCCSPWGCKELGTTEQLNWIELNWIFWCYHFSVFVAKTPAYPGSLLAPSAQSLSYLRYCVPGLSLQFYPPNKTLLSTFMLCFFFCQHLSPQKFPLLSHPVALLLLWPQAITYSAFFQDNS